MYFVTDSTSPVLMDHGRCMIACLTTLVPVCFKTFRTLREGTHPAVSKDARLGLVNTIRNLNVREHHRKWYSLSTSIRPRKILLTYDEVAGSEHNDDIRLDCRLMFLHLPRVLVGDLGASCIARVAHGIGYDKQGRESYQSRPLSTTRDLR